MGEDAFTSSRRVAYQPLNPRPPNHSQAVAGIPDMFLAPLVIFGICIVAPLVGLVFALSMTRSPFEASRTMRRVALRTLLTYYSILTACFHPSTPWRQ